MEKRFIIFTKNGNSYHAIFRKHLVGKNEFLIEMHRKWQKVSMISEKSNMADAATQDPHSRNTSPENLTPGKVIYYGDMNHSGSTSRITHVYQQIC